MTRLATTLGTVAEASEIDETLAFWRKIDAPLVEALLDPDNAPRGRISLSHVARALGRSMRRTREDMDFLAEALDAADLDWYREALGR